MPTSLTSRLTVDLDALVANWVALDALSPPEVETAAVVKGDGYGCGAAEVGRALARDGVETFFVAVPSEGAALREAIGDDRAIYILGGYGAAEQLDYRLHDLRPVLNSAEQARAWFSNEGAPCAIQLDTGMNRLGMEPAEFAALGPLPDCVDLVMSHMGNADDPPHPMNAHQLAAFNEMTAGLSTRLSLSATAGALLGTEYHFDMVRPGIGLYGGWPFDAARPVVRVESPIIQVRDVGAGETVGYGATFTAERPTRIATISAGYADGLIRALGQGASVYLDGAPLALAGRVSMDLITLDVTGRDCQAGDLVEIIGPHQSIDDLARCAGTIGHEILTSLGRRYERDYGGGEVTDHHE
ncbi:MAG: alanine racemase [Pseudomonadota bacterium]